MQISVQDPILQTIIFSILFLIAITLTTRKLVTSFNLTPSQTNELKGLAILMVIFGHTGYFLSTDTRFLYPLSIASGVGVNMFLFLSGFGLTMSSLKSNLNPPSFYLKRLSKIYTPMWVVIAILLVLDFLLLGKTYTFETVWQSFLGFFPNADIFTSVDSPLWYFTFIISYYLIFPWILIKRQPIISAVIILAVSYFILNYVTLPINKDVVTLYKVHYLAFPLGMMFAALLQSPLKNKLKLSLPTNQTVWALRFLLIAALLYIIGFTAINSGIGVNLRAEQQASLITMFALVILIMLKPIQSNLLILFGIYSYEIYLIQWPLMYRFDFLYKYIPASLATLVYLLVFIMLGFILTKLIKLTPIAKTD